MRGRGAGSGRDRMDVAVRLEQPDRAAGEQKDGGDEHQPDYGRAPARRNNETARRSSAARPEAVARRRVRRSPQEVRLMMGEIDRCVKAVASAALTPSTPRSVSALSLG